MAHKQETNTQEHASHSGQTATTERPRNPIVAALAFWQLEPTRQDLIDAEIFFEGLRLDEA